MNGSRDSAEINRAALAAFPAVLARILPGGKRVGAEIVALNPRRADPRLGSFKVNRYNRRWADFATSERGGDRFRLSRFLRTFRRAKRRSCLLKYWGSNWRASPWLTESTPRPCRMMDAIAWRGGSNTGNGFFFFTGSAYCWEPLHGRCGSTPRACGQSFHSRGNGDTFFVYRHGDQFCPHSAKRDAGSEISRVLHPDRIVPFQQKPC